MPPQRRRPRPDGATPSGGPAAHLPAGRCELQCEPCATVAQLAERLICNLQVRGSSPRGGFESSPDSDTADFKPRHTEENHSIGNSHHALCFACRAKWSLPQLFSPTGPYSMRMTFDVAQVEKSIAWRWMRPQYFGSTRCRIVANPL